MEIRHILAQETYPLRHAVLRQNLPIETCYFENDFAVTSFHLGIFVDDELLACASFEASEWNGHQYRLRSLAVLEKVQGKGYGAALIEASECYLMRLGVTSYWCNARQHAIRFYERAGFHTVGDYFHTENVGIQQKMYKSLVCTIAYDVFEQSIS
ncbi:MAG: GNAT family N-acetyltransferase [Culicoidibacterales bacterium]